MRKFIPILLLSTIASRSETPHIQRFKVFEYEAFGPQAMVYDLLGMQWWQWLTPGGVEPDNAFDIQVVVYCEGQHSDIEKRFPVDSAAQKDYRYITKNDAIRYLDIHINEDFLTAITQQLKTTKHAIESTIICN